MRTDEVTDEIFEEIIKEFFMMDWDNSGTIDITEAGRAIFLLTDPFSIWKESSDDDWDLQTWMTHLFDAVEKDEMIAEEEEMIAEEESDETFEIEKVLN